MEKRQIEFEKNVNEWITDFNSRVNNIEELNKCVIENTENIQHNYELIQEIKSDIDNIKNIVKLLTSLQNIMAREKINKLREV